MAGMRMPMKTRQSLRTKVIGLGALIVCVYVLSLMVIAMRIQQTIIADHKAATRTMVGTVEAVLSFYEAACTRGEMTREEAQRKALEIIKADRSNGRNYFWILDTSARMVMHPYRPDLEGNNLSTYTDPNGTKMFHEMVSVCQAQGEGVCLTYGPNLAIVHR